MDYKSIFFVFFLCVSSAHAHVNLFIKKEEMNRTLGVKAELNYIEDGNVNSYSTKFHYRVLENIDFVSFTWNAVGKVEYDLKAEAEDSSVLPTVRLPLSGIVPQTTEEFSVEFRCAGHRSGQFTVNLLFNFYYNDVVLSIKLRQEKICVSKDGRRGLNVSQNEYESEGNSADRIFLIIVLFAASFLIGIAITLICYFRKSKKELRRTSSKPINQFLLAPSVENDHRMKLKLSVHSSDVATNVSSSSMTSGSEIIVSDSPRKIDIKRSLLSLHQDRQLFQPLHFNELEGTFGETRFAVWMLSEDSLNGDVDDDEDTPCQQIVVYTKTLKNSASTAQLDRFLSDSLMFHNIPAHTCLAQPICIASFGRFENPDSVKDFPLVCYKHQGFGNLKNFLVSCRRGDNSKNGQTLRTQQLVHMASQICQAVAHLHRNRVIHNDVATRNCLVAEVNNRLQVQLCDAALSKDIFSADYHCLGDNENRPLKWMSPEAISTGVHTSASDVWSLGVTLWELMTLGATPFNDDDAEDVYSMLIKGLRLPPPQNCPEQLYKIMICCWSPRPEDRPTAFQVFQGLQDFTVHLSNYI